jgi:uncharacterized membrane protein
MAFMTRACDPSDLAAPHPAACRFEVVLYPNRSLGNTGFALLMGGIVLVSILIGAGFALAGAWPVTGFLGLDVLLLYLAFRWHFRQSMKSDIIRIDGDGLVVQRSLPDRPHQTWRFDTAWVQVVHEDRLLKLRSHGSELVIGGFLSADERRTLARALTAAIQAHRLPPIAVDDGPTG